MKTADSPSPPDRLSFEQILEQLYRKYKNLETECQKLAEYKNISDNYRMSVETNSRATENKLAEYTKLLEDYGRLDASYRRLEVEYRKLAEYKKDHDKPAALSGAGIREAETGAIAENKMLKADFKNLLRRFRRLENEYRRLGMFYRSMDLLHNASESQKKAQYFYYSLLLKACSDIILVLNNEMRVVLASDNVADICGAADMGAVLGSDFSRIFAAVIPDEELSGIVRQCHEALKSGASGYLNGIAVSIGGKETILDCSLTPGEDKSGAVLGLVVVMHDVTEIDYAKRRAEGASRSKSSFLATVSHEIRTPLNAVLGLSEIEMQKDLPRETMNNLEKIYSSGSSLLGIINDILDISKIEAGNMELIHTNYNMSGLISSAIQLNLVRIGSKSITFDVDMDPGIPERLYGDELRVKQILNNLLSNAFKYTERGSVKLNVEWERDGDSIRLTFIVADTGQGIREEDLGKLFSEYKQLNTKSNRYIEGTGLGLSITKRLVELMEGAISVTSEFGKGSVFTVKITQKIVDMAPVGEDAIRNLKEFRFAEYGNKMKKNLIRSYMPYGKVLVVDDSATNLVVARGLMLPYGLTIDCVESGKDAIERIRGAGASGAPYYDLVLMDHMMPELDGVEATKIIRGIGTEYSRTVPIIALTANAMVGIEDMFLKNGFDGFISKPIDIMRLDVELNKWIRSKQNNSVPVKAESQAAGQPQSPNVPATAGVPGKETAEPSVNPARTAPPAGAPALSDARVDGIDIQEGLARYESESVLYDVLRTYADTTPQLLNKMRIISRDKLPEYAIIIHGIKGSSYGICAAAAGKWAERLEMAAKRGDLETVLSENNDFIKMMEHLIASMHGVLGTPSSQGAKRRPKTFAPDRQTLERMLLACRQFDINAMDQYLTELEGIEYEYGGDMVIWLREQMDNLEYSAIDERLSKTLMSSRKR